MGWFDKLKTGLKKTKDILNTDVRDVFKPGEILDEEKLERFFADLIRTDMGVKAATAIVDELRTKHLGRTIVLDELWETIRGKLKDILTGDGETEWEIENPMSPINMAEEGPTVLLVTGVNGVGKTTSIAKLANYMHQNGKKVVLAAADTFRAAAVEQLTMWSQRIGCEIVTKESGVDPAAVAHAACQLAKEINADIVIIDTAGRLQTQTNLMDQLGKIVRVVEKQIPGAPHESLLVLDATTGQNGISQASNFSSYANCTGIVLSKLDGSAKGGIVVPIRQEMGIPVKFVGLGEQIDDFQVFNPALFVDALFDRGDVA
ncbi:Signal recognition particle receptor FtsY [Polystyrenella longa]|uniref:Signal recognition particle receptor FtsY n=1 Tax=Polystyrenella longa TaxID=2528007 RepID=A0A518CI12_9PLAN|nr:signal recognition particle-docking protein FtsY [Polystyrenella longa]QDU78863.1 Signal recognition particle receptor FtsY [Polystyrenella longa]